MLYRKEIDGLRAVAVLPVILFHGGTAGFSGGYIGVDIFFVISGYLITSIILEEIENKKFSVINFYERRARRILPALSVVLLFTTIAALILLPPDLLKAYSQSLVSVTTFSSNIFFYLTSGYFSTASDEMPLLHTWSLAVEEQYYLFFPIMISALWFLGKRRVILIVATIALSSLFLSQYMSIKQSTDANFYLIFSRAWELLTGSIIAFLALHTKSIPKQNRELLSITGILLIFYSIIFFDEETPFPSLYTLIPVMGTCAIIIFSNKETLIGRLLSYKPVVFIGVLSYSLYLWHQPLLSFLRIKTIGEPAPHMLAGAITLTFVFSYLSWKFIENPFRNKKNIPRNSIFKFSVATTLFFFAIGTSGHLNKGYENLSKNNSYADTIEFSSKRKDCHTKGSDYLKPVKACKYFTNDIKWAIFGDSHTVEPAYALAKTIKSHDNGLVHLSFSGCPPALLFDVKNPGCSNWIRESLDYLESNKSIESVLLGFRYSKFLYGDQLDDYPDIPNIDPAENFTDSFQGSSAEELRELYWISFSEIINRLLNAEKKVYILYPIPELPVHIVKAVSQFSVFSRKTMIDLNNATSSDYYFNRNKFIINKLNSLPYGNNLHSIKPFEILCNSEYCPAVSDGKSLYYDSNHLSLSGAEKLIINSVINEHQNQTLTATAISHQ